MSVTLNKGTAEWSLDGEYEINRIHLKKTEKCHTHRFIEIVYTYQGVGRHIIDEKEYFVRHGDLLLIDYHCRHTVEPIENLKYVDLMIKPEYVSETLKGTEKAHLLLELTDFSEFKGVPAGCDCLIHFEGAERGRIENLIEWTEEEQKQNAPGSNLMRRSALKLLLSMIFRKMETVTKSQFAVNENMLDYIEKHCGENLRQDELARMCYYTSAHFSRTFKRFTGMTFTEYLCRCRVKLAKRQLTQTDKSIEQIFAECGFGNRTVFFKRFSQIVGCSPLQYRKNQK